MEGLNGRAAAIANLKSTAQDAIRHGDPQEMEALLSRVDEAETEIAAETGLARADSACLRGRVEDACRILSAADSFAGPDLAGSARRRARCEGRRHAGGVRYGGTGLARAIDMDRTGLSQIDKGAELQLWGDLRNTPGVALRDKGSRSAGEDGTALPARSAATYRAALTVHDVSAHPPDWAITRENIAIAELALAGHPACSEGTAALERARTAVAAALAGRDPVRAGDRHEEAPRLRQNIPGARPLRSSA